MEKKEASLTSVEALAYLGDSVLELRVREALVLRGVTHSAKLNRESRQFVTAVAQNRAAERILPMLTEAETDVFRRGRNHSHLNVPKSATPEEYRNATGFECLLAYLHLTGDDARIRELLTVAYEGAI